MRILGIVAVLSAFLSILPVKRVSAQTLAPLTVPVVAADQRLWPKEVITKVPASASVRSGNQAIRTVTLPAGQMVRLLKVERETVRVEYQGTEFTMPATDTDVLAGANTRRLQLRAAEQAAAQPPPFGSAPPALTYKGEVTSLVRRILAKEGLWLFGLLVGLLVVTLAARRAFRS